MREKTVKLCELDSLEHGGFTTIDIDGLPVLYARVGDDYYAIDDTCSHAKVSLGAGIFDEDDLTIECPQHGALFSLESGEALTLPAIRPVVSHGVDVRADGVYITIHTGGEEEE